MKKKSWIILIGAIVLAIGPAVAWGGYVFYTYTFTEPRRIAAQQHFILNNANHQQILHESRVMLNTPSAYPAQPGGSVDPAHYPPHLATLGSTSITIYPDGVMITFDRKYGLWATPTGSTGTPKLPTQNNTRQLYPGLWYYEY